MHSHTYAQPHLFEASQSSTNYYGLVVISALVLLFQCIFFGYAIVGHYRKRVFNASFLEKEFGQFHKDVTGFDITAGGYPDMGSGVYSQRLDYNSWLLFNKAQRIHQNFLESITQSILFLLIGGLEFPITSAVLGFVQVFARFLSISYISRKGATHVLRSISTILISLCLLGSFVLSFIKAVNIMQGQK